MNRTPLPSFDVCLNELLREEQRIATLAHIAQQETETYSVAFSANKTFQPPPRDLSKTSVTVVRNLGTFLLNANRRSAVTVNGRDISSLNVADAHSDRHHSFRLHDIRLRMHMLLLRLCLLLPLHPRSLSPHPLSPLRWSNK